MVHLCWLINKDHITEEVDEKVKQTLRKHILAEFKGLAAAGTTVKGYGDGSTPMKYHIFLMNIHLPAILVFTKIRG